MSAPVYLSWLAIVTGLISVPVFGGPGGRHTRRAIRGHRVSIQLRRSPH
jgi:hypothetical protein